MSTHTETLTETDLNTDGIFLPGVDACESEWAETYDDDFSWSDRERVESDRAQQAYDRSVYGY